MYELVWTKPAAKHLDEITRDKSKQGLSRQVKKALRFLRNDPRHKSLKTHEYKTLSNPRGKSVKVFTAYAQNRTPGAYRIFWSYGPQANQIEILAITPHP